MADHCNKISPAAWTDGNWSRLTQPTTSKCRSSKDPIVLAPAPDMSRAVVTLRWCFRCQALWDTHRCALDVRTAGFEKQHFSRSGPGYSPLDRTPPARSVAPSRTHVDWRRRRARTDGAGAAQAPQQPLETSLAGVLDADQLAFMQRHLGRTERLTTGQG